MSGIYIHIPFCRKACIYCNFHFTTSIKGQDELLKAINKELKLRKEYLNNEKFATIYFGGGTPSLIDNRELEIILSTVYKNYSIDNEPEITLEANPDDLDRKKLLELKQLGINRLSIGIQSFHDSDLAYLSRTHNSRQAINSVKLAQDLGFNNISIDLIYGIPTSDNSIWQDNLNKIYQLEISHFSAYALTVEPKTIFAHKIKKGTLIDMDDELIRSQYFALKDFVNNNNFLHYEISNFGKEGCFSKHNSSYWKDEKYLGIGPSAHSYDIKSRQWNFSVNSEYIKAINSDNKFFTKEILTQKDKFNECLMISLRTIWGLDLDLLKTNFENLIPKNLYQIIEKHISKKNILRNDNKIQLTDEGILFSDTIISELMI